MKYKDWLNDWLDLYVKPTVKTRSYEKYKQIAYKHLIPYLGEKDMDELTATVLQKFTVKLGERLAPNTVNGIISVLKSSLKKALSLGLCNTEHTDGIRRPKVREKKVECFSKDEQKKIETYILQKNKPKFYGIVFCLYTGLRIGELLALRWEDIDLQKGLVSVTKTCIDSWVNGSYVKVFDTPKTECSLRDIPIPKQLLPQLRELKKSSGCDYIVCGGEYGAQVRSYQKTFERLLKKLGIAHKGFHALRHTFATRALECGMDVKTLSEILGHQNPTITLKRYAHSMLEHKTEMMNRLGRLLLYKDFRHN